MTDKLSAEDIKKMLKSEQVIIGTERTIKELKIGKVKKVLIASNCRGNIEKILRHHADIAKAGFIKLGYPNDELGIICKKPFSISVLGLRV